MSCPASFICEMTWTMSLLNWIWLWCIKLNYHLWWWEKIWPVKKRQLLIILVKTIVAMICPKYDPLWILIWWWYTNYCIVSNKYYCKQLEHVPKYKDNLWVSWLFWICQYYLFNQPLLCWAWEKICLSHTL